MPLFNLLAVDNFQAARATKPRSISQAAIDTVRKLDERTELEPWIQSILNDTNQTPHGPSEIVDILTHKLEVRGENGLSAFILKGRSFPTVRPSHVSHQIFRLERIRDLRFALFAASGTVLDDVKEQFVSTASRLGCDYCFLDAHDLARLYCTFGFICPRDGEKIRGGRCSCGYSPTNRTSNVLQLDALCELKSTRALSQPAGVIVLPTGSGKTRIAAIDAKRANTTCCVYVAPSHEILEAAETEFLREFEKSEVRWHQSGPVGPHISRVNLITINLLARNLGAFGTSRVDYLIIDEFHHAAARSYRRSVDSLRPRFLLGLTATPYRGDRQDVVRLCNDNVIVSYELRHGIDYGILCPFSYYGCFDDVDYSGIKHNGRSYDIRDLERALVVPERDAAILTKWCEKAPDKATLAFCCSHAHAKRVAEYWRQHGAPAVAYLSSTHQEERAVIRSRFRAGKIKVLCIVDVLNEGVDLPFVECLLFLRPTESKRVFFQQLGRGLRWFPGKDRCTVVDFIGNFKNAYRVIENLELEPLEREEALSQSMLGRTAKEFLKLPSGCTVEFDERVIDVFGEQAHDLRFASRRNIARLLILQYQKLARRLGKQPTRQDIDRNCLVHSGYYKDVFGSWTEFQHRIAQIPKTSE